MEQAPNLSFRLWSVCLIGNRKTFCHPDKSPFQQLWCCMHPLLSQQWFHAQILLETFGNQLREPHSKPLGDGIYEIRAKVASDITRVLYFFVVNKKIILTNGFVKKTQKTPDNEIALAKKYRKDYLERNKE